MAVRAENLSVKIGAKTLLEDVSFEAASGEIVAVVGANGAGKSTLLKVLASEIKPSNGEARFGDKRLNDWRIADLAKIRAVLPQSFALDFPFTAREVVLLGRTPHIAFAETKRDYEIVDSALEKVEASHFADRFYPTLSGGERQRVQMARVLAQIWEKPKHNSRYLLLDEPTASLDLEHQHSTLQAARDFADGATAVIAVLHDLNLAAQYADKILILQNGGIYDFGAPNTVINTKMIREVFNIEAVLSQHPRSDAPLIIPIGKGARTLLSARHALRVGCAILNL